jgi:hypothetical protein
MPKFLIKCEFEREVEADDESVVFSTLVDELAESNRTLDNFIVDHSEITQMTCDECGEDADLDQGDPETSDLGSFCSEECMLRHEKGLKSRGEI